MESFLIKDFSFENTNLTKLCFAEKYCFQCNPIGLSKLQLVSFLPQTDTKLFQ